MSSIELIKAPNGWMSRQDPGEPGAGIPRWSVSDDEARFLSELFRGLEILEIGTGLGISTNKIAEKAKWVHTVDIDDWVVENIVPHLKDNVSFYKDISEIKDDSMGAAFIDGRHTIDQCLKDANQAKRIVVKGGIIVFHDARMQEVHMAVIKSGIECYLFDSYSGLAVGWNDAS